MSRLTTFVLLFLALPGCGGGPVPAALDVSAGSPAPTSCTVRELSREPLILADGRMLYVDPEVAVADARGDVLLAGTRTYLMTPAPDGSGYVWETDAVFGAVVPRVGQARAVAQPLADAIVEGISALPHPTGGWSVVFGRHPRDVEYPRPIQAAGLWFGRLNERGWRGLEEVPVPDGLAPLPLFSSLLQYGDTLGWAVRVATGALDDIVFFRRIGDSWSAERLGLRSTAYVSLGHSAEQGLIAAIVYPDTVTSTPRPDGGFSDVNSLFLHARGEGWRQVRKISPGPVYAPILSAPSRELVLTWWSPRSGGRELRALSGRSLGTSPARLVDPSVRHTYVPLGVGGRSLLWVTDHVGALTPAVRFALDDGDTVREIHRLPNPFRGGFTVSSLTPEEILISGPLFDPAAETLVTLLIRVALSCRA